jgi:hypothetical protein
MAGAASPWDQRLKEKHGGVGNDSPAAKFVTEMLRVIRSEFYDRMIFPEREVGNAYGEKQTSYLCKPGVRHAGRNCHRRYPLQGGDKTPLQRATGKRFYQERNLLIQAIAWPGDWMDRRGVRLRDDAAAIHLYRKILGRVIQTIKRHGRCDRIKRFSAYLLHSVQEHMRYHGEEYYEQAKAARPISALLPEATRHVRHGRAPDSTTETLARMNQILRSKGGRRRIQDFQNQAPELPFQRSCKPGASTLQKSKKYSQTFANSPDSDRNFSNLGPGRESSPADS